MSAPEGIASKRESVCQDLTAEDLRSVFKFLSVEEIDRLCPYLEVRELAAETTLMAEGEAGDFLGFLVKGRLAVKKETPFAGKYILLAILDPGSIVGEISVLEQGRRNSTITSLSEAQLLILTRGRMNDLLDGDPVLGNRILRRIVQVLSLRLQKADDRLARLL